MKKEVRDGIAKSLGRARHAQRLAVRWLNDARRFKEDFGSTESWRTDDLSETATLVYEDAVRQVINIAKDVDKLYNRLKEYDEKHIRR